MDETDFATKQTKILQLEQRLQDMRSAYNSQRGAVIAELKHARNEVMPYLQTLPDKTTVIPESAPGGPGKLRIVVVKRQEGLSRKVILKGLNTFFKRFPGRTEQQIQQAAQLATADVLAAREDKPTVTEVERTYSKKRKRDDADVNT